MSSGYQYGKKNMETERIVYQIRAILLCIPFSIISTAKSVFVIVL